MEVFRKLAELWGTIGLNQKINLLVCLVFIGAASVGAVLYSSKPTYAVLYSNLEITDAGKISARLQDMNVPYKVTNSGRDILVPADQRYKLRLNMAGEGLPGGGAVGFEIFDKQSLGMTEYVQKINFYRALQGELARTISQMREVSSARVHIVFPKDSFFEEEKSLPTASVALALTSPGGISEKQIYAIRHLVASSVENLPSENITIIDTNGNLLSKGEDERDALGMMSNKQMEIQKAVEDHLSKKAQSMLDKVLGRNMAVIKVAAELNFEHITQTQEKYDPETVVVREVKTEENNSSTAGGEQPAGVQANIAATTQTNAGRSESGNKTTSKAEYEMSKLVAHVVKEVGNIKRLSVAVFIRQISKKDEQGTAVKVPSDEEITAYGNVIKEAVGYDPKRGDKIEVKGVAYDTYKELASIEEEVIRKQIKSAKIEKLVGVSVKYIFIASLAFSLLLLIKSTITKLPSVSGERKEMIEKVEELEKAAQATMSLIEEEAAAQESEPVLQERQKKILSHQKRREEINKIYGENMDKLKVIIKENPEAMVALIQTWLAGGEESK